MWDSVKVPKKSFVLFCFFALVLGEQRFCPENSTCSSVPHMNSGSQGQPQGPGSLSCAECGVGMRWSP